MQKKIKPKQIIGRREMVDFPELGVTGIFAKIDTGAYSNTLHCHAIRVKEKKLCFKVLDPTHPVFNEKEHCFENFSQKKIKNSFGEAEKRFVIKTKIRIAGRTIKSIISLTDRGAMRYPVLIGRRLLKNKFVVDVSIKN
ncbi:MAG: ATP-dependent zinc protease [Bacteroidetes bacterium]|nr:ATP-dependent zinc protease [Bacteroidota bacterium]